MMTRRTLMSGSAAATLCLSALTACDNKPAGNMQKEFSDLIAAVQMGKTDTAEMASNVISSEQKWRGLNGFISFDAELLIADARACDALRDAGGSLGSLHGLPIALKDNIDTENYPTSGGTPALAGNQPGANASLVKRLLEAGAIVAGKANMHELSAGGASDNHTFGVVGNPYDPDLVPGGSSGGPAALVAAGVVPASIGTDTAGSVRVPAALCGVVGLRPSQDRYPADGIVPLSISNDTAGPMAKSVSLVAALDSVLAADPTELSISDQVTLGVPRDPHLTDLHPEIRDTFETAQGLMQDAGLVIKDVDFSPVLKAHSAMPTSTIAREFIEIMGAYLERSAPHLTISQVVEQIASPNVNGFMSEWIAGSPPDDQFRSEHAQALTALRAAYEQLFESSAIDALVFPTTKQPALPRAPDDTVILAGEQVSSWLYFSNTRFAATSGMPGLSLPMGISSDGRPLSLELDGLFGQDRDLLNVAARVEQVLPPLPPPTL